MPESGQVSTTTSTLRQGGTLFYFEILEPGQTFAKSENKIAFPAFIDSIDDSFGPSWGTYNDMGRADPKVMLESFSRQININFKLVALKSDNGDEYSAQTMFNKLDVLAKAVTPAYVNGKGFVGRFVKFTIAKLWIGEYGYISALNASIAGDNPWTTDQDGQGERPKIVSVTMTINWVGNKRPDSNNAGHRSYSNSPGSVFRMRDL